MIIVYNLNEINKTLFSNADSLESLKIEIGKYFSYNGYTPKIIIINDAIVVEFDDNLISSVENEFEKAIELCNKGKFDDAYPILQSIIKKCPLYSEAHRNLGQIKMMKKDIEGAINELIEALKIDPKNYWALILMGNIFAKEKEDIDTAMKYYNGALEIDPSNNIAINNIAANLMQLRKYGEAEKLFLKALDINSKYPNTYYGLAMIYFETKRYLSSFNYALNAAKCNTENNELRQQSLKMMIQSAQNYCKEYNGMNVVVGVKETLESRGNVKVEIVEDNSISTAAKFEFAKNHKRSHHVLRYKTSYPNVEHLMLHELMHLELALEAQEEGYNKLFISSQKELDDFYMQNAKTMNKHISALGRPRTEEVFKSLFDGINLQIFNTPIDLFVEDKIFREYEMMRPFQFLSMFSMQQENIKAVTNPKLEKMFPSRIVSISRIFNMTSARHFTDLFSIDLLHEFKASKSEIAEANQLYNEFLIYRNDRAAGEEYDLVNYFAQTLHIENMYRLEDDKEYFKGSFSEKDSEPMVNYSEDQKADQENFDKQHKDGEDPMLTMMMSMYMVGALEYFEGKSKEEIKKIAFDIAWLGTKGLSPEKKSGYSVASIPGKDFGGYQMIAFYYVSWALAVPEMLEQLHLPFSQAYATAQILYGKKKNNEK